MKPDVEARIRVLCDYMTMARLAQDEAKQKEIQKEIDTLKNGENRVITGKMQIR